MKDDRAAIEADSYDGPGCDGWEAVSGSEEGAHDSRASKVGKVALYGHHHSCMRFDEMEKTTVTVTAMSSMLSPTSRR